MIYDRLLSYIPLSVEQCILVLRIAGILAILLLFRNANRIARLQNSLSVEKARQLIDDHEKPKPVIQPPAMPILELEQKDPEKPKRPLLYFTLSEEAQSLLDRISLEVSTDNGWIKATTQNLQ